MKIRLIPQNPNKKLCVARNINFAVQKENEYWLKILGGSIGNQINIHSEGEIHEYKRASKKET